MTTQPPDTTDETETKDYHDMVHEYVPFGIASFADLASYREGLEQARMTSQTLRDYKVLLDNIVYDAEDGGGDVPTQIEDLTAEFVEQLRETHTAHKSGIRSAILKTLEALHIKAPAFLTAAPAETPESIIDSPTSEKGGIMVWKDANGADRWAAAYSNSFRDEDYPPEIISADSHRDFVKAVESGETEYPELWLWHEKDLAVGQADWVAVDEVSDDVVFALAGGHFYDGMGDVAETLADIGVCGVSHGMPVKSITRDTKDTSIIIGHRTIEISPLTVTAAANKLAQFYVIPEEAGMDKSKETDMIEDEKRKKLEGMGIPADILQGIEARNAAVAAAAKSAGVQSKEAVAEEAVEEVVEEVVKPVTEVAAPEAADPQELTVREQALVKSIVEAVQTSLIAPLEAQITALTSKLTVAEAKSASLPMSAMQEFVGSIIGKSEAVLRKNDPLLNQKPKETAAPADTDGMPAFLANIINPQR